MCNLFYGLQSFFQIKKLQITVKLMSCLINLAFFFNEIRFLYFPFNKGWFFVVIFCCHLDVNFWILRGPQRCTHAEYSLSYWPHRWSWHSSRSSGKWGWKEARTICKTQKQAISKLKMRAALWKNKLSSVLFLLALSLLYLLTCFITTI